MSFTLFMKREKKDENEISIKKRLRRLRLIEAITFIVCFAMLGTTATYSWLKRKWAPKITQTGIQIMAGESLVFSLIGGNIGTQQTVFLNDVMNLENFMLRPVSNLTGESDGFFKLNTSTYEHEYFSHITLSGVQTSEGWTTLGLANGYIEQSFMIQGRDVNEETETYTKYVYLTHDTHVQMYSGITDAKLREAEKAIRVSLTIEQNGVETTYLFADYQGVKRTHKATTDDKDDDGNWIADGVEYRASSDTEYGRFPDAEGRWRKMYFSYNDDGENHPIYEYADTDDVHLFSEFMGGFENNGTDFNDEEVLFAISPGQTAKITLRIWLEGEDDACTGSIKGSQIDFLLGFASWNIDEEGGGDEPGGEL